MATAEMDQEVKHRDTFHMQNFPAELRRQVKVAAALAGKTMTDYVVEILAPAVKRDIGKFAGRNRS